MATGVVFVIVLVTKFLDGAYLIVIAIPVLFALMRAVNKHYATVPARSRWVSSTRRRLTQPCPGPGLEGRRALAARAGLRPHLRPHTLEAITASVGDESPRSCAGTGTERDRSPLR